MKKQTKHIPWLVITICAGFIALTVWSILNASLKTSAVSDRDYYSHGLRYNETLLEKKTAESLGWTTGTAVRDGQLIVWLKDGDQNPVSAANGVIILYDPSSNSKFELPLVSQISGKYIAELPTNFQGSYQAMINFELNGARISKRLLIALK
ncbi:MAG: FixH family protein [Deltaproteobacteria bacterium]|jgi:nitrogen fixation protein FixH|nr:FixH family protein [Deltaproteobacteria bacterium]MBW2476012.1 FixH family protein [Deltaproteobacteria bacterium]MBW2503943.1 FixH family protein [Deltaproteobacteria bacterium]MBW2519567.1 FixH family protein [Deltaproteobacteria bacterium]